VKADSLNVGFEVRMSEGYAAPTTLTA
jgi:hypothetical protein